MSQETRTPSLRRTIVALTASRLIINMTRRFAYPFIVAIAQRLHVPTSSIQNALALQSGIGITSPIFGPLSERYGRKRVMVGALLLMAVASFMGVVLPQFWFFAGVMVLFGVGKMIFDPAMQAYLGDQIPYNRRAYALGITELSWAGALIIAAPLTGLLLETSGLATIFLLLTVLLTGAAALLILVLPADEPPEQPTSRFISPLMAWRNLQKSPSGAAALAYSLLLVSANEMFFINYGIFMEMTFDLVLAALGIVTIVIAAAEVCGEFIVIGIGDRFGKRRLALMGAIGAAISYPLLPNLTSSLPLTLAGLFAMFVCVEVAIVASIPLFTEILPDARAVMMSSNVAAHSLGRMAGAVIGAAVFAATGSFQFVGILALLVGLAASISLWLFIHE